MEVPATFFVPGWVAERRPGLAASIVERGHEVAHHSYAHRPPTSMSPQEERADFVRALEVFARQGIEITGFRAALWGASWLTTDLVAEHGLRYDSSLSSLGLFVPNARFAHYLPLLLVGVALLVASALGVGEWMPRIPGISQFLRRANGVAAKFSPTVRAGAMGALTPLLPCGLLYGLFGSALVTGSFGRGALLAGGFAVGGIPALLLAQLQTNWIRRLPSGSEFLIRRVVPLAAALVVAVRALSTIRSTSGWTWSML